MKNDSKPPAGRIPSEPEVPQATVHPGYESDDGPLTDSQMAALRQLSARMLPSAAVVSRRSLF